MSVLLVKVLELPLGESLQTNVDLSFEKFAVIMDLFQCHTLDKKYLISDTDLLKC